MPFSCRRIPPGRSFFLASVKNTRPSAGRCLRDRGSLKAIAAPDSLFERFIVYNRTHRSMKTPRPRFHHLPSRYFSGFEDFVRPIVTGKPYPSSPNVRQDLYRTVISVGIAPTRRCSSPKPPRGIFKYRFDLTNRYRSSFSFSP